MTVGVVVQCINYSPTTQEPHVRFQVETIWCHKRLNKRPIKAALMCASKAAPPSGHSWTTKPCAKTFASQSPTISHTNGSTWLPINQFPKITEVNSCIEVLGKTSHIIGLLPLSTQQWWVPGGTKIRKLWTTLDAENALNFPQRRWDHLRENSKTRGVNCKVCWTHGDFRLQTSIFPFTSSWSIKVSIATQRFATSSTTDCKGSDTTWELRMHLHMLSMHLTMQCNSDLVNQFFKWKNRLIYEEYAQMQ